MWVCARTLHLPINIHNIYIIYHHLNRVYLLFCVAPYTCACVHNQKINLYVRLKSINLCAFHKIFIYDVKCELLRGRLKYYMYTSAVSWNSLKIMFRFIPSLSVVCLQLWPVNIFHSVTRMQDALYSVFYTEKL